MKPSRDFTFAKMRLPSPERLRKIRFVLEQLDAEMLIAVGLWLIPKASRECNDQRPRTDVRTASKKAAA